MEAILFAILAYLGWGSGDIFGAIASRRIGAYSTAFWAYFLSLLMSALYIPFALVEFYKYTGEMFFLNIFLGVILLIAFTAFTEGLRVGNVALVGTVAASFAPVTVLLSVLFLGEKIDIFQIFAMVIIFSGFLLTTFDFKKFSLKKFLGDKGIILALISMVGWAVYFTFIKIPIDNVGWFWPAFISVFIGTLVLPIFMWIKKIKLESIFAKKSFGVLAADAFLINTGGFAYNLGLSKGLASIVAPIAGAYPTLFVALAFLIFKEPLKRQQILGIFITLIGIVALSFMSS